MTGTLIKLVLKGTVVSKRIYFMGEVEPKPWDLKLALLGTNWEDFNGEINVDSTQIEESYPSFNIVKKTFEEAEFYEIKTRSEHACLLLNAMWTESSQDGKIFIWKDLPVDVARVAMECIGGYCKNGNYYLHED